MAAKPAYEIGQDKAYEISRSKIEDFVRCQKCFVLDRRHKLGRPSMPAFTLNSAVDSLLKKEFDTHRAAATVHPELAKLGFAFVPYQSESMDLWRNNFKGLRVTHEPTNLVIHGALDDVWQTREGHLIVVDYKATAKSEPVEELTDAIWHQSYRRQLDVYHWLLVQLGHEVSETAYWFYVTGRKNEAAFNQQLIFDSRLIPHNVDSSWVEPTLIEMKKALENPKLPESAEDCEHCKYYEKRRGIDL
jgi:hypothetical protein